MKEPQKHQSVQDFEVKQQDVFLLQWREEKNGRHKIKLSTLAVLNRKKKALVIIIIAVITETYSARNIPTSSRLPRAKIVIQTIIQSWQ